MGLHERINLREWFARQVRAGFTWYPTGWLARLPIQEVTEQAYRCYGKSVAQLAVVSPHPIGRRNW